MTLKSIMNLFNETENRWIQYQKLEKDPRDEEIKHLKSKLDVTSRNSLNILKRIEVLENQNEKLYSEEDLKEAYMEGGNDETIYKTFQEWFKQFKNK